MKTNETVEKKTLIKDLTVGSVPKELVVFALPLVFSGILQAAYNMVDMIVVGRFIDRSGISAVSIGGDILLLLTFIAMGFSNAGQILISHYVGAGDRHRVSHMIGTLFTFLGGSAVAITIVCFCLRKMLLSWLNTPPEAWDYTMDYIVTCMAGLIFIYGYNLVSAILRGMGDSRHPFLFIAIASVLNAVLDVIFIGIFHWAVFGAAFATVIGQAVSFICAIVILYRRRDEFMFDFKLNSFAIDPQELSALIALGVPMSLQAAAITISRVYVSSWVNSYGVVASAVSGVGHKIEMVNNMIAHAFSTAGGSMVAQCIGARKYNRVGKVMLTALAINGVMGLAFILILVMNPYAIFSIFTKDAETLTMAITYVPVAAVSIIGGALRPAMFSLINGSGNSRLNLIVALLDGIIGRIGLGLLLGLSFGMGVYGFWYGNAFAGWAPFAIGMVYYFTGSWKRNKNRSAPKVDTHQ